MQTFCNLLENSNTFAAQGCPYTHGSRAHGSHSFEPFSILDAAHADDLDVAELVMLEQYAFDGVNISYSVSFSNSSTYIHRMMQANIPKASGCKGAPAKPPIPVPFAELRT